MKKLLLGAASLALITACAHHEDVVAPDATVPALAPEPAPAKAEQVLNLSAPDVWGDWGINLDARDTSVKPGDDFFRYVNGTWIAAMDIPADRSRYGSFDLLREKSEQRMPSSASTSAGAASPGAADEAPSASGGPAS